MNVYICNKLDQHFDTVSFKNLFLKSISVHVLARDLGKNIADASSLEDFNFFLRKRVELNQHSATTG
jgi:hypothetical protein